MASVSRLGLPWLLVRCLRRTRPPSSPQAMPAATRPLKTMDVCPSLLLLLHLPLRKHLVHDAELERLLGIHEVVPLHVLFNLLERPRLRQVPLVYLVQLVPHAQYLLCVVRDVARLPAVPAARLVDHDPAVRQDVALAGAPAGQQQRAHGRGLPHADGGDGAADVVHGVVDGHAGGDGAAGGVYVQGDGFGGVVGLEEEQLGSDGGGHGVVYFAVEADDALREEAREDVRRLPAAGLGGAGWLLGVSTGVGAEGALRTTVSVT
jgi:hypothetical protein